MDVSEECKKQPLGANGADGGQVNPNPMCADLALNIDDAALVQLKEQPVDSAMLPIVTRTAATTTTASMSIQNRFNITNIDADDRSNEFSVSQYANDIFDYLYELEAKQPIHAGYLSDQLAVTPELRTVLIDWLHNCNVMHDLTVEIFYLTVAIVDRYLQVVKDTRSNQLQLVGVTALLIATKYEQHYARFLPHYALITGGTYSVAQIRRMEVRLLKALEGNLSRPLPIHFLQRYLKAGCAKDLHRDMSSYFLELASLDHNLASEKPSQVAAASLFLSLHLLNDNGTTAIATGFNDSLWTPTLVHYSHYTAAHLRPVTQHIAKLVIHVPTTELRSIYLKYLNNAFHNIAMRAHHSAPLLQAIVDNN